MTDASNILTPLNIPLLAALLKELFGLEELGDVRFVHGGYMGQNFRIDTSHGVFFLKQYRDRINTIIHEIKTAEVYFAQQGLPIILPIKDVYGREAFWLDGNWYSLFPFIDAQSPKHGSLTPPIITSLASMLARFHQVGSKFTYRPFQSVRIGNRRKFHMEKVELERLLRQKKGRSALDDRILEILNYKAALVAKNRMEPQDAALPYTCLLHGDFQYFNTFVNTHGEVTHVYDLERASIGPTEYEFARSLIINCFDDGWEPRNYDLAKTYTACYRDQFPLTYEALLQAVRLYSYSIIHMTWIETRYVVFGVDTQLPIFERHIRRLMQMTTGNLQEFCERVWK